MIFAIIYAVLFLALFIVEMIGVLNTERRDDTISEYVWRIQKAYPPIRWIVAGFFIWVLVHFFTYGLV